MGLYEVPLSMSLLATMLAIFHMCGIMFQHAREECESKRTYVFRCLFCQDLVSYYFYFVLLPLGPELL